MPSVAAPTRPLVAKAVYGLLDPIPYGLFVAGLIFDVVYARSGELMWVKSAAWLIAIGLVFAVIPRLINLVQVWITPQPPAAAPQKLAFWLNLLAIAAALVNAFVHSRDAYSVVPDGVWLSVATVVLLAVARVLALRTVEVRHAVDGRRSVHA